MYKFPTICSIRWEKQMISTEDTWQQRLKYTFYGDRWNAENGTNQNIKRKNETNNSLYEGKKFNIFFKTCNMKNKTSNMVTYRW